MGAIGQKLGSRASGSDRSVRPYVPTVHAVFDEDSFLDLDWDRQLEEARLRMDVSSAGITAKNLSPEERLAREAKTWLDRQVIAQECEWDRDHDLELAIENVALNPRLCLWLRPAMRKK